jgi:hypothetical protein
MRSIQKAVKKNSDFWGLGIGSVIIVRAENIDLILPWGLQIDKVASP